MKANDLTGKRFGTLEVLKFDKERHDRDINLKKSGYTNKVRRMWICKCDSCGKIVSIRGENLISGNTKGCGCKKSEALAAAARKYNKFILDETNKCAVFTTSNEAKFIVDEDDVSRVLEHSWHETTEHRFATRINHKLVLLHRFIFYGENIPKSTIIDHINRNPSDCRKSNLRECTPAENARNRSIDKRNTSGVMGVSYSAIDKKWRAWVCVNWKYVSLGYYSNKEDAIKARKLGEKQYYGEFAPR